MNGSLFLDVSYFNKNLNYYYYYYIIHNVQIPQISKRIESNKLKDVKTMIKLNITNSMITNCVIMENLFIIRSLLYK